MPRLSRAALTAALAALALLATPTAALAVDDPPPAPVGGLAVTADATSVTLTWTLPADADLARVVVRRADDTTTPPATPTDGEEVASGLLTTWTDQDVDPFRSFAYAVFAQDTAGQWSGAAVTKSQNLSLRSEFISPDAGVDSVRLSWTWSAASSAAAGMRVRTVTCQASPQVLNSIDVPRATTSLTIDGLPRATRACFRVQEYGSDGRGSPDMRSATAVTWGAVPVGDLTATPSSTRVALAWTSPDDPEATGVRISRRDLSGTATPTVVYEGGGTSWTDTHVTSEHDYDYSVVAVSPSGGSPVSRVRTHTSLAWTTKTVSPYLGSPAALSCPRETWCLSLDSSGRYQVLDGTTWSAPRPIGTAPRDSYWRLTCPQAGWCLATGPDGLQIYAAGRWRTVDSTPQPSIATMGALTCASPTWCVALSRHALSTVFDGTRWTTPASVAGLRSVEFQDVACQVAGRCFAVGVSGGTTYRATLERGRWTTGVLTRDGYTVDQVECPTTTWCLAAGTSSTWTVSGTRWSERASQPGVTGRMACASPTLCLSVDVGRSVRWSGRAWSSPAVLGRTPGQVTGLSCPRGGTVCHAVDDQGRDYRWTPTTHWRFRGIYDPTSGGLHPPTCVSAVECLSLDDYGWLVRFDGTRWTRSSRLFSGAADLSCTRSGFCLGSQDGTRRYRVRSGGSWSPTRLVPMSEAPGDVSCTSSTFCMGFDDRGRAWRFTGTTWVTAGQPFSASAGTTPQLRCTSSTFCMAESFNGRWSRWSGSRWTTRAAMPTALTASGFAAMDCSSSTQCLAVVDSGATAAWSGSSWRLVEAAGPVQGYRLAAIDCVTASWCLGAHGYSNSDGPAISTGGGWGDAGPYRRPAPTFTLVCPTTTTCISTGGGVATWTTPTTTG